MTMEDRLNAISLDSKPGTGASATAAPKTDSLATLLAQGLQSQDSKILDVSLFSYIYQIAFCVNRVVEQLVKNKK